ncbi:hypothetical protein ACVWYH_003317 [Bradyrhizobium sp. GM24.11]
MFEQGKAGRCRLDPFGMAVQQLDLETVLDIRDPATDRGRGDVLLLRRLRDTLLLDDRHEQLQRQQIDFSRHPEDPRAGSLRGVSIAFSDRSRRPRARTFHSRTTKSRKQPHAQ